MKSEKEVCAASPNVSYNDALFVRIAALEQKIDSMQINDRSRSKLRNYYRNISQSRSRSIKRFNPKGKYCFYHFKFGVRCRSEKCYSPCAWRENSGNSMM
ncbi:hypothetical protein NPIL_670751 [Nephila pilipes]|uniref:Uncharacterized protein n=1 Tax=Nephila pilipes TaxID=299642 RepID=A0A8X6QCN4_NEPPI|nr:hypothetical protein NPIL_670751 [Nephila pilipes]